MFDQEKYNRIVEDNYERIFRYCLIRLSYIKQDAEEVTDDVMITLFSKWDLLDVDDNISAWLYRTADICIKRCISKRSPCNSPIEAIDDYADESEEILSLIEDLAYKQIIEDIINLLPDELKDIFIYRFVKHMPLMKIQKLVDLPYSTMWIRIEKIKKIIKNSKILKNPDNFGDN